MTDASAALRLEAVSRRFGTVEAVDNLSLEIGPGEMVCLLGPSGCGKTTALRLVAGLERPDGGRILLGGATVFGDGIDLPPEQRDVGLLFQDFALFPHLDVTANIGFGLRRLGSAERDARVADLIERLDIGDLAGAYPHTLSGGQQQRVALARALAPRPRLMLLDEPFSNLDPQLRGEVREQTFALLRDDGCAVMMVTHDAEEALSMADRVAVMRSGRLLQIAPPAELYGRPRSRFVAGFIGPVNEFPGMVRDGAVATPLGRAAAPALPDGAEVLVIVRPERLRLAAFGGVAGTVVASRFAGGSSLLTIRLEGAGLTDPLLLRTLDSAPLPAGRTVAVEADPSDLIVVPATSSPPGP